LAGAARISRRTGQLDQAGRGTMIGTQISGRGCPPGRVCAIHRTSYPFVSSALAEAAPRATEPAMAIAMVRMIFK
jgi:hypothetical protein